MFCETAISGGGCLGGRLRSRTIGRESIEGRCRAWLGLCWGAIPACAGVTLAPPLADMQGGCYPCVCRGNGVLAAAIWTYLGHPRVCGEPLSLPGPPDNAGGYPRVCGVTFAINSLDIPLAGLSPRVRGYCTCCYQAAGIAWAIPACAGLLPASGALAIGVVQFRNPDADWWRAGVLSRDAEVLGVVSVV